MFSPGKKIGRKMQIYRKENNSNSSPHCPHILAICMCKRLKVMGRKKFTNDVFAKFYYISEININLSQHISPDEMKRAMQERKT